LSTCHPPPEYFSTQKKWISRHLPQSRKERRKKKERVVGYTSEFEKGARSGVFGPGVPYYMTHTNEEEEEEIPG
jgi:hypothetical protein